MSCRSFHTDAGFLPKNPFFFFNHFSVAPFFAPPVPSSVCFWLHGILSLFLQASSVTWQSCLRLAVNRGLLLLYVQRVFTRHSCPHGSWCKMSQSQRVHPGLQSQPPPKKKLSNQCSAGQGCNSSHVSWVHLFTVLTSSLADFNFSL